MAVEAGVGRCSVVSHGEIGLELDEPIIPGYKYLVNNIRVNLCHGGSVTGAPALPWVESPIWRKAMGQKETAVSELVRSWAYCVQPP